MEASEDDDLLRSSVSRASFNEDHLQSGGFIGVHRSGGLRVVLQRRPPTDPCLCLPLLCFMPTTYTIYAFSIEGFYDDEYDVSHVASGFYGNHLDSRTFVTGMSNVISR